MKWATRQGIHIDRATCAWLIRRHVEEGAQFLFVTDAAEVPPEATPFELRGVELGHHGGDCSLETILRRYDLTGPALAAAIASPAAPYVDQTAGGQRHHLGPFV